VIKGVTLRMGIAAQKVNKYQSESFAKSMLYNEEEDLKQEAYLMFVECQKTWNKDRGAFSTYYNTFLRNHFLTLLKNENKMRDRNVYDDSEETCSLFDMIPSSQWQADDMLEYEELVKCVESRLDGIFLKVFRAKLEMPIDFESKTKTTKVNCRTLAIYFNTKFPEMIKINRVLQDITLTAVKNYMEKE
jgi:hypothetical protein